MKTGSLIFIFLLVFSLVALPQPSQANLDKTQEIDRLRSSRKIIDSDSILRSYLDGESEAHVIVRLQESEETKSETDLREPSRRQGLRARVEATRDRVLTSVDLSQARVSNLFSYMPGFAATVTVGGLRALVEHPGVVSVEPDRVLSAQGKQGIPLMNAMEVRGIYNGQGLSIAFCDTGIDYNHSKLGGGGFPNAKVIGGYDYGGSVCTPSSKDGNPIDQNGHGTSCAGIAAGDLGATGDYIGGVAHQAKLYALKISCGSTGNAYESDMISAWEWCITHQNDNPLYPIKIISTSFGGGAYADACDDASPSMTQAAANAVSAGITIFAASGNNGYCDAIAWPACISHVISVGAVFDANIGGLGFCVDASSCAPNKQPYTSCSTGHIAWAYTSQADQVAPYSNVSSFLDLLAPSHKAYTTALGGGYKTDFGGTSAACPYAAGVAASMQSAAKAVTASFLTPAELRAELSASGNPITYTAAGITKPRVNLGAMDIDGDGLPAEWEIEQFGNLEQDGIGDPDMDDLTTLGEYDACTSAINPDTDGDGYTDGFEVSSGSNPLDPNSVPQVAAVPALGFKGCLAGLACLAGLGVLTMRRRG